VIEMGDSERSVCLDYLRGKMKGMKEEETGGDKGTRRRKKASPTPPAPERNGGRDERKRGA